MSENKPYSVQDLLDVIYKGKRPPECDLTMKLNAYSAEQGIAKGTWTVGDEYINGHGVVMGGFVTAAADIMMAYAIASKLEPNQGFSSISIQTTFHRPTLKGSVDVEARVERLGGKVAYLEADLVQNGKKVATATSSMLIFNNL